jgi:hypothetical protein
VTQPRTWSLSVRAEAADFADWIAEAEFGPGTLRVAPLAGSLQLDLQRVEHARASDLPSGLVRLLGGVSMPVGRWKLDLLGVSEASLDLDPDKVEFIVRDVVAGPTRLAIRGVSGGFEARGENLAVRAEPAGTADLEAVRVLGVSWFRRRET